MNVFEGPSANDVWLQAVAQFRSGEGVRAQKSRAGLTHELSEAIFTIEDPRQRWIVSRHPAINPAFAIAEVVWIVNGRNDSAFINFWNPKLPLFAGRGSRYHGAYGHRIRSHFGVDQLSRAYKALLSNPDSRQVALQIWDAAVDLPREDGSPASEDIPCNICSFVKIRNGKLEWTQVLRSNDLFLGVPHNFVQFTSLQEILAGWLGVEVGSYRHWADCLHIYDRDLDTVQSTRASFAKVNGDDLRFPQKESTAYFSKLAQEMDQMRGTHMTAKKLRRLTMARNYPESLTNWMLVVAADCARRRKWVDLSFEIMSDCTNPALNELWDNWFSRWWSSRREETVSTEAVLHAQPLLPLHFSFG